MTQEVGLIARHWKSQTPLLVYGIPTELSSFFDIRGAAPDAHYTTYNLDAVVQRLVHQDALNMSFLRLQGASSDEGVSFTVPGVYTEDTIVGLSRSIEEASVAFYKTFLKPVTLTSVVATLEKEGGQGGFKEVREIG